MFGKKRIALLMALILLLGLTACGGKNTQPQVALCLRQADDGLTAGYHTALESALTKAGYTVTLADAKNDQAEQLAQIDVFIAEGYDLLVVDPVLVAEAETVLEKAKAEEIPVIFINHEPAAAVLESWDKTCFVGSDAAAPGLMQGELVLDLPNRGDVNGDGVLSYVVVGGPEDHMDAKLRAETCVEALAEADLPLLHLCTGAGDWTRESGERLCREVLAKYGRDIEVVFCSNGAMAVGAAAAISDSGWILGRDIYLVGIDADQEVLNLVQQDKMIGTVGNDIQSQVDQVLAAAVLLLEEQPVEDRYYIDYTPVTRQTMAE